MGRILGGSTPVLLAAIFSLCILILITGCETETKTLEDYLVNSPSAQQEIEESLSALNNADMEAAVSYHENQIIINCNLKTTYRKTALKAMKKSYKKYLKKHLTKPMEKAVASIEQETGVTGVTIQVNVNNGNGKAIWSRTYPQEAEETEGSSEPESEPAEDSDPEADQSLWARGSVGSGSFATVGMSCRERPVGML